MIAIYAGVCCRLYGDYGYMGNEDAVYKLFQQLPDHPELITAENVAMLPVNAWAGVLIRLAQDNLQTAGVGEDVLAELDITSAWKRMIMINSSPCLTDGRKFRGAPGMNCLCGIRSLKNIVPKIS